MIIDALANMDFYQGLNDQLYKGLAFLKETDVASLPVGRYEIEGDAVFALVQESIRVQQTMPLGDPLYVHGHPVCRGRQRKDGLETAGWHREKGR